MVIKFGIWEINESGIIGRKENGNNYPIEKKTLWDTRNYNDKKLVWDWLIHIAGKAWMSIENINDFNIAFCFAQDYFKEFKPNNLPDVSIAQSLYIQKQLMEISIIMENNRPSSDLGLNVFSEEGIQTATEYNNLLSNIKFLGD